MPFLMGVVFINALFFPQFVVQLDELQHDFVFTEFYWPKELLEGRLFKLPLGGRLNVALVLNARGCHPIFKKSSERMPLKFNGARVHSLCFSLLPIRCVHRAVVSDEVSDLLSYPTQIRILHDYVSSTLARAYLDMHIQVRYRQRAT